MAAAPPARATRPERPARPRPRHSPTKTPTRLGADARPHHRPTPSVHAKHPRVTRPVRSNTPAPTWTLPLPQGTRPWSRSTPTQAPAPRQDAADGPCSPTAHAAHGAPGSTARRGGAPATPPAVTMSTLRSPCPRRPNRHHHRRRRHRPRPQRTHGRNRHRHRSLPSHARQRPARHNCHRSGPARRDAARPHAMPSSPSP